MKEKTEKLVPCPIARSSNHDAYNDICGATGQTCPYFIDEGMSVCKSKAKCLSYFAKKSNVNLQEVAKLMASNTKSSAGAKSKYTNTIKPDKDMQKTELEELNSEANQFMEELEAALKQHEVASEERGESE